jgi:hypothetical protein
MSDRSDMRRIRSASVDGLLLPAAAVIIMLCFPVGGVHAFWVAPTTSRHVSHGGTTVPSFSSSHLFASTFNETSISTSSTATTPPGSGYDAGQITVLEGLDPVRKRPGMYIGSTGPDGLHHLVWEVVDNCVDEALAGHATFVTVTLNEDKSCTVIDDGRGIPVDKHKITGKSALETVLTVLHAGGKFDNQGGGGGYKVSGGLHGVGISVVNALSESVEVQVDRNAKHHQMTFQRGVATSELQITDKAPANSLGEPEIQAAIDKLKSISKIDADDEGDGKSSKARQKQKMDNLKLLQSLMAKRKSGTKGEEEADCIYSFFIVKLSNHMLFAVYSDVSARHYHVQGRKGKARYHLGSSAPGRTHGRDCLLERWPRLGTH